MVWGWACRTSMFSLGAAPSHYLNMSINPAASLLNFSNPSSLFFLETRECGWKFPPSHCWVTNLGSPNNGSMVKGARLIQSEGQAKLYFAPSIENQTDRPGPSLAKRRPLPASQTNFYRVKAMWLSLAAHRWPMRLQYTEKTAQSC